MYRSYADDAKLSELNGKTIKEIVGEIGDDELHIKCTDGSEFLFYHSQDCCEDVWLEDVTGYTLKELEGETILNAFENSNQEPPLNNEDESYTWTFYDIRTTSGKFVTLRFYGVSNGYYSESVDFLRLK